MDTSTWIGFFSGLVVGLALAIVLSRVAGSVRGLSSVFGRDPMMRKIRDLEKELAKSRDDCSSMSKRLQEKDELIRKAMASLAKDHGPPS